MRRPTSTLRDEVARILTERFQYSAAAVRNMIDGSDLLKGEQLEEYRLARAQALANLEAR